MKDYYSDKYHVTIDFEPKWAFIGSIRSFVENFISTCIKNPALGKSVALTASELLENAVKYSTTEKISLELRFQTGPGNVSVILKVRNNADREKITGLRAIMEELNQLSPQEGYLKRMREILMQDKQNTASRLGLPRIRHECGAELQLEVSGMNTVIMTASLQADIP